MRERELYNNSKAAQHKKEVEKKKENESLDNGGLVISVKSYAYFESSNLKSGGDSDRCKR